LVVPIVLYHGARPWTDPARLTHSLDAPKPVVADTFVEPTLLLL